MHDDAGPGLDHRGQQPPVEPDRGEQVQVQLVLPLRVAQCGEATRARVRAADGVDQDVQDAEAYPNAVDNLAGRRQAC